MPGGPHSARFATRGAPRWCTDDLRQRDMPRIGPRNADRSRCHGGDSSRRGVVDGAALLLHLGRAASLTAGGTPPGSYDVTARRGGRNLGNTVALTVTAAFGPPTEVPAESGGGHAATTSSGTERASCCSAGSAECCCSLAAPGWRGGALNRRPAPHAPPPWVVAAGAGPDGAAPPRGAGHRRGRARPRRLAARRLRGHTWAPSTAARLARPVGTCSNASPMIPAVVRRPGSVDIRPSDSRAQTSTSSSAAIPRRLF